LFSTFFVWSMNWFRWSYCFRCLVFIVFDEDLDFSMFGVLKVIELIPFHMKYNNNYFYWTYQIEIVKYIIRHSPGLSAEAFFLCLALGDTENAKKALRNKQKPEDTFIFMLKHSFLDIQTFGENVTNAIKQIIALNQHQEAIKLLLFTNHQFCFLFRKLRLLDQIFRCIISDKNQIVL
jgi:hypothetical protein